jgi:P27 family predicted phage terminase small subunit
MNGNPGRRPLKDPVRGSVGAPSTPSHLQKRARALWKFFVAELEARPGGMDKVDAVALADLCVCCERIDEAEADIAERGILVESRDRGMVKNPALQIARTYRQSAQRYFDMFGFAPSARGRLNVPEGAEDDEQDFTPPPAF